MFAFAGPAYLVSVGYMDPGNWATDLEGGARFGYQLLWVLVMSNAMAVLLQTLSARLGIVRGLDLAQACRASYPRPIAYSLWFLCEVAIAACDLAEVLGAAIGLNLLFNMPILMGVAVTSLDTLLLLWLQKFGVRKMEAFVLSLVSVIGVCFLVQILLARPNFAEVATGLIPRLSGESLYVAIGMLGATVMPHNLYLHSALVQTRRIDDTRNARKAACHYNFIDSVVALNGALLVNAAILVVSASVFFKRGIVVTEIQQAHLLLAPLLGTTLASIAFAVALLCAGQSSTLTGTLAGQIVMEGFLNFRMSPWLRRLLTRALAIIPAALTVYWSGEQGTYKLLILSQVILSMQLPFAVIPLIHFTSDADKMGEFANRYWVRVIAWVTAAIIVVLNVRLVVTTVGDWLASAGSWTWLIITVVVVAGTYLAFLLAWVTLEPWIGHWVRRFGQAPFTLPGTMADSLTAPKYSRILVPLDHTELDRLAVSHAIAMAKLHHAKVFLLHVEEGVTSRVYGEIASTKEVEAGKQYLEEITRVFLAHAIEVESLIVHEAIPKEAIVRYAGQVRPDLLIMGAHGHNRLKDLIFGDTINPVRHALGVPILVVRS